MPTLFLLLVVSLFFNSAFLQGKMTPAVGDTAPDFTLTSVTGKKVQLEALTKKSPVVLVVLRGYPGYQCPMCNMQVRDFIKKSAAFAQAGAQVVLVYPGAAENVEQRANEFLADKKLPDNFELLLDPDYTFTNQYGLRWDAPKETAYPATFLIDQKGKIFFAKVSKSHGGRTNAGEILAAFTNTKMER